MSLQVDGEIVETICPHEHYDLHSVGERIKVTYWRSRLQWKLGFEPHFRPLRFDELYPAKPDDLYEKEPLG